MIYLSALGAYWNEYSTNKTFFTTSSQLSIQANIAAPYESYMCRWKLLQIKATWAWVVFLTLQSQSKIEVSYSTDGLSMMLQKVIKKKKKKKILINTWEAEAS